MKLWTLQTPTALDALQREGVLRADPAVLQDPDFGYAYAWMKRQMECRVGPPPTPDAALLWAWVQWRSAHERRPDLRSSGFQWPGTHLVRIEFEADASSLLQSDFSHWHAVLNNWYLPYTEEELDRYFRRLDRSGLRLNGRPFDDPDFQAYTESSWPRVFDLDTVSDYFGEARDQRSIQAVFWELRLDQVRHIKHFRCR